MKDKVPQEMAELELEEITDFFEVEPEGKEWEDAKKRMIKGIKSGRLTLNKDKSVIKLILAAPIDLENGKTIDELEFKEPMAAGLRSMDKYKDTEKMAKTISIASHMTDQPMGIIERMGARDLQMMGAITSIFF